MCAAKATRNSAAPTLYLYILYVYRYTHTMRMRLRLRLRVRVCVYVYKERQQAAPILYLFLPRTQYVYICPKEYICIYTYMILYLYMLRIHYVYICPQEYIYILIYTIYMLLCCVYKYACAGAQNFSAARTRTEGPGSHERRARRYTNIICSRHATPCMCCFTVLAIWLICEYKLKPHLCLCMFLYEPSYRNLFIICDLSI